MKILPFQALRPPIDGVEDLASPPYDVINTAEARALAQGRPKSFLHIIRPEIDLPPEISPYAEVVYETAKKNFDHFRAQGWLQTDPDRTCYVYRQEANGHHQTGLVACCLAEDYDNNLIVKHEKTLQKKEDDRTRHVDILDANTGPVFLAYPDEEALRLLFDQAVKTIPLYDFRAPDGVRHTVWKCDDPQPWQEAFSIVPRFYVADGHHRSASAARVARMRREANPEHTGNEEYNGFLSVIFPASDLRILAYNRLVLDLNGLDTESFLQKISAVVHCEKGTDPVPAAPCTACMRLDGAWYRLHWEAVGDDPVAALDVSVLQDRILGPLLGIGDPRTDSRIEFVGGIRGTAELEAKVDSGYAAVAFSLHPTSMEELMRVADADRIMPPKSTWFEPKLRSGLLVHPLS